MISCRNQILQNNIPRWIDQRGYGFMFQMAGQFFSGWVRAILSGQADVFPLHLPVCKCWFHVGQRGCHVRWVRQWGRVPWCPGKPLISWNRSRCQVHLGPSSQGWRPHPLFSSPGSWCHRGSSPIQCSRFLSHGIQEMVLCSRKAILRCWRHYPERRPGWSFGSHR